MQVIVTPMAIVIAVESNTDQQVFSDELTAALKDRGLTDEQIVEFSWFDAMDLDSHDVIVLCRESNTVSAGL